jgi:hypothetical protein
MQPKILGHARRKAGQLSIEGESPDNIEAMIHYFFRPMGTPGIHHIFSGRITLLDKGATGRHSDKRCGEFVFYMMDVHGF